MYIELSSGDLVKSSSGNIFEILALRNYGRGYLTVVLINRDTREDFEVEFCNFKTEYKLLTDFDVSKQYVEGKHEGIKEGYNSGYNKGFEDGKVFDKDNRRLNYKVGYNDGWHDCEALFELGNDFTDSLKKESYNDGYKQACKELAEEGDDFWDDEDELEAGEQEENYCFIKDLEKVLEDAYKTPENPMPAERKHSHYFKDVRHLDYVDIYQICKLFPVDDDSGAIVHARKKLLVAGGRGAGKDMIKDITEARDTLSRYLQIEGYE